MSKTDVTLEDITSLCKRRGFIYQGSEIYGGLAGTWDYGPLGLQLKKNIMNLWWKTFVEDRSDMYGVDGAILMNQKTWQASGHVDTFVDPLCEDTVNHKRFRTDHILKDNGHNPDGLTMQQIDELIANEGIKSPDGNPLSESRTFNMMFETFIGPNSRHEMPGVVNDGPANSNIVTMGGLNKDSVVSYNKKDLIYLRPETAQAIFTNYRNIVDSFSPNFPFGIAQQGKAFRNEISPRDFVFRSREFEQMEIEYFVHPDNWEEQFELWRKEILSFFEKLGLPQDKLHELEVPDNDLAHYSKRTIDFEFEYPHGKDELAGFAYRTDFDLSNVQRVSGKNMQYRPKDQSEPFVPHVLEPSFGVERAVMAVLTSAYWHDTENDRIVLRLPKHLAPVKMAVSPLLKNKPELVKKAQEVFGAMKEKYGNVMWDDNGNIGKRYRRQDEIGTPTCVVIDFDTLEDDTVTVRDRDTTEQTRVKIEEL
ncbi:TPA: glycine--tRNA ligase [Candidatus Saccharibacteria bacterium]|nr:glycine--tRNA ligase [Candidatus Saccharibacteria bacterium]HIO87558.1 glycine--tRNA ligase [Candidatus Saccharibacteria bacterium]